MYTWFIHSGQVPDLIETPGIKLSEGQTQLERCWTDEMESVE